MILSTLPDLPGRTYDVIGVVFSKARLYTKDESDLGSAFNTIFQQASGMGADAIVDIKMVAPSPSNTRMIIVIGTAVKLR